MFVVRLFSSLIIVALSLAPPAVYAGTGGDARSEAVDSAVVHFLQREYDVRFSSNNRCVFFFSGQEKFDDLFRAVDQARHTIHLEYFNFRNDSISRLLFARLAAKVGEGVKVRVLFDGFGNSSNDSPLKKEHLDSIRAQGIEIYEFLPMHFPYMRQALHRDHRKIVVVDGMVAYTGGMNVADYYVVGREDIGEWRDVHLRVEGDVVAELQSIFVTFWNYVTGQNLQGPDLYPGEKDARDYFHGLRSDTCASAGSKLIGVTNRVPFATGDIVRRTFVEAIDAAQDSILIVNPYFTLNGKIERALRRALRRGVKVEIMISEKCDIPITPEVASRTAWKLHKRGATVYFYQGGFHHSKIMMIDGVACYVGSANLNSRSLNWDYECNLFIADRATTDELIRVFERDKGRCYEFTRDVWKEMKRRKKFCGWFFSLFRFFVDEPQAGEEETEGNITFAG